MNRSPSLSAYRRTPEPRPRLGRLFLAMLAVIVVGYLAVVGFVSVAADWMLA